MGFILFKLQKKLKICELVMPPAIHRHICQIFTPDRSYLWRQSGKWRYWKLHRRANWEKWKITLVLKLWNRIGERERYAQQGRGVQKGQLLHLCQADPEEKTKEGGGRGGRSGDGWQISVRVLKAMLSTRHTPNSCNDALGNVSQKTQS